MLRAALGSDSTAVVSGSLVMCRTDSHAPEMLCNVKEKFAIPRFNPQYDVVGVAVPCTSSDTTMFYVKVAGVANIATSTANIPVGQRIGIQFENNTRFAMPVNHYDKHSWNVAVPVAFKRPRDTASIQMPGSQSGVWRSLGCRKRRIEMTIITAASEASKARLQAGAVVSSQYGASPHPSIMSVGSTDSQYAVGIATHHSQSQRLDDEKNVATSVMGICVAGVVTVNNNVLGFGDSKIAIGERLKPKWKKEESGDPAHFQLKRGRDDDSTFRCRSLGIRRRVSGKIGDEKSRFLAGKVVVESSSYPISSSIKVFSLPERKDVEERTSDKRSVEVESGASKRPDEKSKAVKTAKTPKPAPAPYDAEKEEKITTIFKQDHLEDSYEQLLALQSSLKKQYESTNSSEPMSGHYHKRLIVVQELLDEIDEAIQVIQRKSQTAYENQYNLVYEAIQRVDPNVVDPDMAFRGVLESLEGVVSLCKRGLKDIYMTPDSQKVSDTTWNAYLSQTQETLGWVKQEVENLKPVFATMTAITAKEQYYTNLVESNSPLRKKLGAYGLQKTSRDKEYVNILSRASRDTKELKTDNVQDTVEALNDINLRIQTLKEDADLPAGLDEKYGKLQKTVVDIVEYLEKTISFIVQTKQRISNTFYAENVQALWDDWKLFKNSETSSKEQLDKFNRTLWEPVLNYRIQQDTHFRTTLAELWQDLKKEKFDTEMAVLLSIFDTIKLRPQDGMSSLEDKMKMYESYQASNDHYKDTYKELNDMLVSGSFFKNFNGQIINEQAQQSKIAESADLVQLENLKQTLVQSLKSAQNEQKEASKRSDEKSSLSVKYLEAIITWKKNLNQKVDKRIDELQPTTQSRSLTEKIKQKGGEIFNMLRGGDTSEADRAAALKKHEEALRAQKKDKDEKVNKLRLEQERAKEAERLRKAQIEDEEAQKLAKQRQEAEEAEEAERLRLQEAAEEKKLREREEAARKLQIMQERIAAEEQKEAEEAKKAAEEAERLRLQEAAEEKKLREREEAARKLQIMQERIAAEEQKEAEEAKKAAEEAKKAAEEAKRLRLEQEAAERAAEFNQKWETADRDRKAKEVQRAAAVIETPKWYADEKLPAKKPSSLGRWLAGDISTIQSATNFTEAPKKFQKLSVFNMISECPISIFSGNGYNSELKDLVVENNVQKKASNNVKKFIQQLMTGEQPFYNLPKDITNEHQSKVLDLLWVIAERFKGGSEPYSDYSDFIDNMVKDITGEKLEDLKKTYNFTPSLINQLYCISCLAWTLHHIMGLLEWLKKTTSAPATTFANVRFIDQICDLLCRYTEALARIPDYKDKFDTVLGGGKASATDASDASGSSSSPEASEDLEKKVEQMQKDREMAQNLDAELNRRRTRNFSFLPADSSAPSVIEFGVSGSSTTTKKSSFLPALLGGIKKKQRDQSSSGGKSVVSASKGSSGMKKKSSFLPASVGGGSNDKSEGKASSGNTKKGSFLPASLGGGSKDKSEGKASSGNTKKSSFLPASLGGGSRDKSVSAKETSSQDAAQGAGESEQPLDESFEEVVVEPVEAMEEDWEESSEYEFDEQVNTEQVEEMDEEPSASGTFEPSEDSEASEVSETSEEPRVPYKKITMAQLEGATDEQLKELLEFAYDLAIEKGLKVGPEEHYTPRMLIKLLNSYGY